MHTDHSRPISERRPVEVACSRTATATRGSERCFAILTGTTTRFWALEGRRICRAGYGWTFNGVDSSPEGGGRRRSSVTVLGRLFSRRKIPAGKNLDLRETNREI